jgi:hypothetical protein
MTPELVMIPAAAALVAVTLGSVAALRGWQNWLELRREQLTNGTGAPGKGNDLTELKRRVRKLEAIASGID